MATLMNGYPEGAEQTGAGRPSVVSALLYLAERALSPMPAQAPPSMSEHFGKAVKRNPWQVPAPMPASWIEAERVA